MGQAVPVRTDYTASEVRRFARRAKDGAQARRLLAFAAVLDGASREEAAKIGGMDRQTLRDWVIRYNEQGPDGLINIPSPGAPPKLDDTHKAFLRRLVDEGPIPAIHGVVRWRACDLIMRLHDEFGALGVGRHHLSWNATISWTCSIAPASRVPSARSLRTCRPRWRATLSSPVSSGWRYKDVIIPESGHVMLILSFVDLTHFGHRPAFHVADAKAVLSY